MKRKSLGYHRSFDPILDRTLNNRKISNILNDIWHEYERRLGSSFAASFKYDKAVDMPKAETAKYFMMREIYALGRVIIASKVNWNSQAEINKTRTKTNTRPDAVGDPFHDLLLSLYDQDVPIRRQVRSEMAREMQYAHRHDIQPELLCGFLLQSGSSKDVHKKMEDESYLEPAFRESNEVNDIG